MKAGELREMLVSALAAVRAGELKAADAKAIAALAGQVNLSLQVELNIRAALVDRQIDPAMGALEVAADTVMRSACRLGRRQVAMGSVMPIRPENRELGALR